MIYYDNSHLVIFRKKEKENVCAVLKYVMLNQVEVITEQIYSSSSKTPSSSYCSSSR